jgi:hypothetical protein
MVFKLQHVSSSIYREIEDIILLALQSPEVYDDIARGTRCKFETNRPRAVLFEGPPGELLDLTLICYAKKQVLAVLLYAESC